MAIPVTKLPPAVEHTGDRQTQTMQVIQRRTQDAVNARGAPPNLLNPVTFTAAQQIRIPHKLARTPIEWDVVDVIGGYGVFQRISWDASFITIQSQNACTATFRVS